MAGIDRACYIALMNIALQRVMTVQEFLAWAEAQSERPHAELINGRIVPKYPITP